MAKVDIKRTVEIMLTLSEDEVQYLLGLLQNDPYGGNESAQGKLAREGIYEALERATRLEGL